MRGLTAVVLTCMVAILGSAAVATAAEADGGTVKAVAAWKGHAFAFPVGEDQAYLVGVYSGTFYVEDGTGALHAAQIDAGFLRQPARQRRGKDTIALSGL